MKFFIVDAFAETPFGGNPAGVILIDNDNDFPTDDRMLKTAAELRYSETAFVKKLGEDEYNVRYFTPTAEVDLCGHATIAAFYALYDSGEIIENKEYTNHTLAGSLKLDVNNGMVMMDMGKASFISEIDDVMKIKKIYNVMGLKYAPTDMKPQIISTGLPDIMLPVTNREELERMAPDMTALTEISRVYDVTGVHAFTLDSDTGVNAHCRNFAPLYGINEEAATGTSNGALTYYLYRSDVINNHSHSVFIQGEAMGRPSKIISQLDVEGENTRIRIGGKAIILARGDFIPED